MSASEPVGGRLRAKRRRAVATAAAGWMLCVARLLVAPGAALTTATVQAAPPPAEQRRIDALLDALASDRHSRFVRAGVDYSGADAARFLRAKMQAQGGSVRTAEDFVERIASRSSTTGRPYRVCRAGGGCVDAAQHLRALLVDIGQASANARDPLRP